MIDNEDVYLNREARKVEIKEHKWNHGTGIIDFQIVEWQNHSILCDWSIKLRNHIEWN